MFIYWVLFIVLAWLAFIAKDRKMAFKSSFVILLLLGATRGSTVGNDMRNGYSAEFAFIHADPSTWGNVMYQFEVGFAWLMGNFKDYVSDNKMLFFHLLFAITFIMRYYTLKRYSVDGAITMFFMFGLAYYFAMYNTMRQELAFSIICIFFPLVLEQKRYVLYAVLTILTSYLFHKSQIIFLLMIPFAIYCDHKIFSTRNLIIALVISLIVGTTMTNRIMTLLGSYAYLFMDDGSNYAGYLSYTDSIGNFSKLTPFLHTLFCIYTVYVSRQRRNNVFLLFYVVGVMTLNILTPISWIYQRIAYAFMFFSIFVFTSLWFDSTQKIVEHKVFKVAVTIFVLVLFSRRLLTDDGDVVPYVNYFLE